MNKGIEEAFKHNVSRPICLCVNISLLDRLSILKTKVEIFVWISLKPLRC